MVCESPGSKASELTLRLAMRSLLGVQRDPPFDRNTPPETAAAYMFRGLTGSISRARVRPAMLVGPRAVHTPTSGPVALSATIGDRRSICSRAASYSGWGLKPLVRPRFMAKY